MEALFYWTGMIVWLAIGLCVAAFVVGLILTVVAPDKREDDYSSWQ